MLAIIISVVCMLAIVVLDQVSKYHVVAAFDRMYGLDLVQKIFVDKLPYDDAVLESTLRILHSKQPIVLIPNVLNFSLVLNDGMALGLLDNARWVFMTLSSIAIVAVLVYMFWKRPKNKLLLVALTLVTGGGIGNMIDRIWLGYVVDFIDFKGFGPLWVWVFNVADSCVTVGACILALWMILDLIKEYKKEKALKLATVTEAVAADAEPSSEGIANEATESDSGVCETENETDDE